jgi:hypothetical protein
MVWSFSEEEEVVVVVEGGELVVVVVVVVGGAGSGVWVARAGRERRRTLSERLCGPERVPERVRVWVWVWVVDMAFLMD